MYKTQLEILPIIAGAAARAVGGQVVGGAAKAAGLGGSKGPSD
jgi:hypothetical protein